MRRDYLPVADPAIAEDEFVERYWTEKWADRGAPPDVSVVARREEYRLMAPMLDGLSPGSRLLDGGCGTGEWTVFLSQRGFDVIGIDISAATIARLQRWFPTQRFVAGDLRHTAFADASFDAYFSWGTFEHFDAGLAPCIDEAHRILRPGGWLFISVPFHNWRLRLQGHPPAPAAGHRFYQWRLTRPELRQELTRGGFDVERITAIGKDTGASRWLRSVVPGATCGSVSFRLARRTLSTVAPSSLLAHMILATARRR